MSETKTIDVRVSCDSCHISSNMTDAMIKRPVITMAGVFEVGLKCPKCSHYRRAYWDHPKLDHWRSKLTEAQQWAGISEEKRLEAIRLKTRFNAEFDRTQTEISTLLNGPDADHEDHLGPAVALKLKDAEEAVE